MLQFRENLSDRQAADAVRARIDWKYLLGLELSDSGFDFSVLCEFRARLIAGGAADRLLDQLLVRCRDQGLLKARGRQRTDSTHVLAAIRDLNRLELLGETMRAALNELAAVEPAWLRGLAPKAWFDRYSRRVEDSRLPRTEAKRQTYAQTVGEDGFTLLALLDAEEAPSALKRLPKVMALRTAWARHFDHDASSNDGPPSVRFKSNREVAKAEEKIESPYDVDARYRSKRGHSWTGYMVHQSETCDDDSVHLITHVHTTSGDVHEAMCTAIIHQALDDKGLTPKEHLADAAYISADLLIQSQDDHGIELVGPPRPIPNWQSKVEGAYTVDQFTINWQNRVARCPEGATSTGWYDTINDDGQRRHKIHFPKAICLDCNARALCTKAKQAARQITLPAKRQYQALQKARDLLASDEGHKRYARRAGVEGTLSQAVRAFGARRSRYAGLAKNHLQQVATAAAINLDRLAAWFDGRPQAATRTSRFAALAA
jgi:IS5 family transposase